MTQEEYKRKPKTPPKKNANPKSRRPKKQSKVESGKVEPTKETGQQEESVKAEMKNYFKSGGFNLESYI